MKDTYFATLESEDLIKHLNQKANDYYDFAARYAFMDRWRRAYLAYYNMSESGIDGSRMSQAGDNGDRYIVKANQLRSLMQSLLTMTTAQRPVLQPKAQNTDSKSLNQTIMARSILEHYLGEKHLENKLRDSVEFSLISGEGFIELRWNATAGKEYAVDENGRQIYDGDLEYSVFHPVDVIRECWAENSQTPSWKIIREFRNKYDLAVKYPDLAEKILSITKSPDFYSKYHYLNYDATRSADFIPVYRFYHPNSESLPNGRQVEYIDSDIVLNDGSLAYKNVPVFRIAPANYHGTIFGYTPAFDLMGLQKYYDALLSMIATNQMNYGVQNIMYPKGSDLNPVQFAQGLNGLEYDPKLGEPKPLNLVQTPREIIEQSDRLQRMMETLSGVNSVARGNVDRDMSGAAMALVASQAVQFNRGLEQSYNLLLEDVGTGVIEILQTYATTPRIAAIAGKSNRSRIKEFVGSDLEGITRVSVEQVNPISRTPAGRMELAKDMLQSGLIKNPQHYLEVMTTGQLDALYEHETSQILNIRSENEDLTEGKMPKAILTDQHRNHINEHATVLDSPEARQDPGIVQNTLAHINEHLAILDDPNVAQILIMLGQEPLAPPQGPQPQGPGPGGAPPASNMGGSAQGAQAAMNPTPPLDQQAGEVKGPRMPNMPKAAPLEAQAAYEQMKANTQQ